MENRTNKIVHIVSLFISSRVGKKSTKICFYDMLYLASLQIAKISTSLIDSAPGRIKKPAS